MGFEDNNIMRPTAEQLAEWEKKYKKVHHIVVEDKECWIKTPGRAVLDAAQIAAKKAPSKFDEIILKSCWLAGDKEIVYEDEYFYGAAEALSEVVTFKKGELKKNTSGVEVNE